MQNKTFVIVGITSWDSEIGSNIIDISTVLSKKYKVLFVSNPVDRINALRSSLSYKKYKKYLGKGNGLKQYTENIWVYYPEEIMESINWIRFKPIHRFLLRRNCKKLARLIMDQTKKLQFKEITVINDNNFLNYRYLKEYLNPNFYIYYLRDYLHTQSYFKKHGVLEGELMQGANAVAANSAFLSDYAKKYNPNSHFVGQGIGELYLNIAQDIHSPYDLDSIKRPIIGYAGALISSRLDISMIKEIAEYHKDKSIVLVGPEDEVFKQSDLHKSDNVFFLGAKKPDEIPGYIKGFDVCINPQLLNPLTIGNYPRKIDEYLAIGKPVVATKTETMKYFADCVYLAENLHDYNSFIQVAIDNDNEELVEKRISVAKSHTWEVSINKILKLIN